ncbi:hypothetical protein EWB00_000445 [Schistosoma japonicum]|uniref:Uncharacterized protein n=1 Tax=Schistosoma japonicum TaxID=6182 RepID=A0A4Z2CKZ5_SCHJA|nr:hypothetical protein EWB00_000445 [Schistosoma japonicum]
MPSQGTQGYSSQQLSSTSPSPAPTYLPVHSQYLSQQLYSKELTHLCVNRARDCAPTRTCIPGLCTPKKRQVGSRDLRPT